MFCAKSAMESLVVAAPFTWITRQQPSGVREYRAETTVRTTVSTSAASRL